MADLTATFETGVNGNTISTGDPGSATAWDEIFVLTSLKYDNNPVAHGLLSAELAGSGTRMTWNLPNPTDHYGRVYIYTPSIASNFTFLIVDKPLFTGAATISVIGGKITAADSVGGTSTGVVDVATNQWVRIEYHIVHSATVGQIEVKLFNNAESVSPSDVITSPANRNTATDAAGVRFCLSGWVGPINMDTIVANATAYPGSAVIPPVSNQAPVIYGRGAC